MREEERLMSEEMWIDACSIDDIDMEDVIGFDHNGHTYAVYRSPEDTFHATDGLCTHERAILADGLVLGNTIECPKHNGRFDYRSGQAKRAPARINLRTYGVKVQAGRLFINIA